MLRNNSPEGKSVYRRMLVPLDGSKLAEETIPYARELAVRLDLDLDFLHVSDPVESQLQSLSSMSEFYVNKIAESVREQIQRGGKAAAGKEATRLIEVKGNVVAGYPADEILRYAEKNKIDIILMATHGASGVRRWALGSVAYQVLHASKIPVWLVRSGIPEEIVYDKWPQRTILVPLDGSKLAESALLHAEALAKQRGTPNIDIVLLSVYAPSIIFTDYYFQTDYPPVVPLNYPDFVKQQIKIARERCELYLKNIADQFKSKGFKISTECVMGEAAEELIKYANKNPFQLIVMASHGRSGLRHLTFGSVAEKILLESKIPIFMVTPSIKAK
jgi:nucleotide-binding universal stress UspA family protein